MHALGFTTSRIECENVCERYIYMHGPEPQVPVNGYVILTLTTDSFGPKNETCRRWELDTLFVETVNVDLEFQNWS